MRVMSMVVLLSLVLLAACDSGPGVDPDVTGRVVDAAGEPVAGAAVGIVYRFDGMEMPGDWERTLSHDKPQTELIFDLPEPVPVRVTVWTHDGRLVRTLVDWEDLVAGVHMVAWDGTADDGTPQPSGRYLVRIEREGSATEESDLFLYLHEPGEIHRAPHALTDADGRFRIRRSLLPLGEELVATDETGEVTGTATVASDFKVMAVRETESGYLADSVVVDWPGGPAGVDVTLTLEF